MHARQDAAPAPGLPEGPFVGRTREQHLLGQLVAHACAGHGQALAIVGEAGLGKTRLALQCQALAEARGMAVRWGRCLEEPGAPPYWPWRQLLRAQWRTVPVEARHGLDATLLATVAAIAPELAAHPPAADGGGESAQRFALYDAMAAFWATQSARTPLLLVIDDLHRADPGSLRLLQFVAAEAAHGALMLLVTLRDDEPGAAPALQDTLAELGRLTHFRRLRLARLSRDDTAAYLRASTAAAAAPPALADELHARTEGHPLFLVETVRLLAQQGDIGDGLLALRTVPDGVRELIARRLARLPPTAGRVLGTAACIGREFDSDLLARLEVELDAATLAESLDSAVQARLIENLAAPARYRFTHTLVRETLAERLAPAQRARLHRRIGEGLEARLAADPGHTLPQLAHHFQAAGDADKALAYAGRAAAQAAEALAHEDAAALYRQALALLDQGASAPGLGRLQVLGALGDVELAVGNARGAAAAFLDAAHHAGNGAAPQAFARAAIGFEKACVIAADSGDMAVRLLQQALALAGLAPALRAGLEASLCRALLYTDHPAEAAQARERAVALARASGDPLLVYTALSSFASGVFVPALLPQALQGSIEAWQTLERAGRLQHASAENNAWLLFGLLRAGQTEAALAQMQTMGTLAERSRSPYHQAIVHCAGAALATVQGRFDDAEALARQAHAAGRRAGAPQADSVLGLQMFCIRREQGRLAEVRPVLQQLLAEQPASSFWRPGLALLHAELGQTDDCRAVYAQLPWAEIERPRGDARTQTLLAFTAETCVHLDDAAGAERLLAVLSPLSGTHCVADLAGPHLGSADRLLGMLAAVCRQWDRAERHFAAALDEDARSGCAVPLAHGRHRFALMLRQRGAAGDHAHAARLLQAARDDAARLGLQGLRARIEVLTATPDGTAAWPCGLTQREVEVLRLAAIGRSNRDIATVLDISPNTVAKHMRSILEKSYTANRTEAAAFARQQGLLPP